MMGFVMNCSFVCLMHNRLSGISIQVTSKTGEIFKIFQVPVWNKFQKIFKFFCVNIFELFSLH